MHYIAVVHKKPYAQVNWRQRIAALLCSKILHDQNFNIWNIYKKRNRNTNHDLVSLLQLKWHSTDAFSRVEVRTAEDKQVVTEREESQQGWQGEKTALEVKGETA